MAGNAIIGALRVVLGADTAALEKGLKDAQSSLGSFGASFAKAGAAATTAFTAAGIGIGLAIKGAINEADKLNKMSQSIGVPVEKLSALKYAAELSDISIEQLGTSLGKLGKNLTEAAAKPTSEAANAFRALGVATTDSNGKLRSQEEVLLDVAEKFSGLKDGAGKTAVAMAIFGRAGADMIPFLNQGRDGIKSLTDRAAELGVVIGGDTAARAEKFNDTMKDIWTVFKAVAVQVAAQLLPTMQELATRFSAVAANGQNVKTMADAIGAGFIWVFNQAEKVILGIQRLGIEFTALSKAVESFVSFDKGSNTTKFWNEFIAAGTETQRLFANLKLRQELQGLADGLTYAGPAAATAAKNLKDFNYAALGGKTAIDSFLASLEKKKAGLEAEMATIGLSTGAHERLKVILEAEAVAKSNNINMSEALKAKIQTLATGYGELAQKVEDAKERFNTIKSSMDGVSSKFEDALVGIADGSKKAKDAFADMTKGILSDLIRLMIRLQITIPLAKALTGMFGGGVGGPTMVYGAAGSTGVPTFGSPSGQSMISRGEMSTPHSGEVSITIMPGAKEDRAVRKRGNRGETLVELHTKLTNAGLADGSFDSGMGRFGGRPVPVLR